MKTRIVELDQFRAVGVCKEINCVNGNNHVEIPKMWEEFNSNGTTDEIAVLNDAVVEGLLGICIGKTDTEIDYWIATSSQAESNFDEIIIPASKWIVFEVETPVLDNIPDAWQYIFSDWFVNNGYAHGGAPDMEVYNHENGELTCEIWISIK